LENNLLFPRDFPVTIQATDFSSPPVSGAALALQLPYEIEGDTSSQAITFSSENFAYETRQLTSREIYEDRIVSVSATCEKGGVFLDRISRNVFIPATPVSDTGLVVAIDTVFADKFPEIGFVFWVEIAARQQKIFKLRPENLFLFENGSRIQEFVMQKDAGEGLNEADIIFVLDVTGSMGNEIASVKNNIIEFADSLSFRGVDFRLGMVTFLDEIENIYAFTDDVQLFQQNVAAQFAHGGGDYPENSLEALLRATRFAFRPRAQRIVIWITDASFHERDAVTSLTKETVVDSLLAKSMTVHAIGNAAEQTAYYDPIIIPTGGNFYDINGNFRDILLDISRLKSTFRHRVTYASPSSGTGTQQIRLEIHYAGLGGEATINYTRSGVNATRPLLVCYPNPFNPQTKIYIDNPAQSRGEVAIYNVLGQKVREFSLSPNLRTVEIVWDARDGRRLPVAAGFYLVQLRLHDESGKIQTQAIRKILYVK
jgi:Mg-chelatase subunit ChlD